MMNVKCVCGAFSKPVDFYDAIEDGFYMLCSDACKSVLSTRESWSREYGWNYLEGCAA